MMPMIDMETSLRSIRVPVLDADGNPQRGHVTVGRRGEAEWMSPTLASAYCNPLSGGTRSYLGAYRVERRADQWVLIDCDDDREVGSCSIEA